MEAEATMRPWLWLPLVLLGCNNSTGKPTASGSTTSLQTTGTGSGTGAATGTATGTGTGTGSTNPADTCAAIGLGALHGGQVFSNIQTAIDDALDSPLWVYVCPGVYAESLVIGHDVRLEGVGGSQSVTLSGNGLDPVVSVNAGDTTLFGFTITGGGGAYGGGVDARSGNLLNLEDCIVTGNSADYGGGVFVGGSTVIRNSELTENTAHQYGGGLGLDEDSDATLETVAIASNTSLDLGGGLFAFNGVTVVGTAVTIEQNTAADSGGGLYLWGATASGLTVQDNSAVAGGGGVFLYEGGSLFDATSSGNDAARGGGVAANLGIVDLEDVSVDANTATSQGGGLHFDEVLVTGTNLTATGNHSDDLGGGAYVRDTDWSGGVLDSNDAATGGGVYLSSFSTVDALTGLDITGNTATESGGGIASLSAALTGDSLVITGNASDNRGGGFYNSNGTALTLTASTIDDNSAISYGGGLYLNTASTGVLSQTSIDRNLSERGGGVYVNAASTLDMVGGSIAHNGDGYTVSGGGIRIQEGDVDLVDVDLGDGPDENAPDDIYCLVGPASYLGYGAATSTTCDELACAPIP